MLTLLIEAFALLTSTSTTCSSLLLSAMWGKTDVAPVRALPDEHRLTADNYRCNPASQITVTSGARGRMLRVWKHSQTVVAESLRAESL